MTAITNCQLGLSGGALSVDLTLYHNASDAPPPPSPPELPPLGYGWTHSYQTNLSEDATSGDVTITEGDGRKHVFTKNPDSTYTRPKGSFETLVKNADGSFRMTRKDQIKWNFASSGRLISILDLNNNSVSLSYDGAGRLTSLADPSGRTLSFAYDANGFLSSVTDPINRTFTFSYSGTPRHLWKANEPSPSTYFIEFGYDATERVSSLKDKRGNSWTVEYHPLLPRVFKVTNPESNYCSYFYLTGTSVTDENGNQTNYSFGSDGQVVGAESIPGPGTSLNENFTYDDDLNLTSFTRPSGAVWEFTWDSNGNLLTLEDPVTRTDPNLTRATLTYNGANRLTSARDASGHQHDYGYDSQQRLTQVNDPAGNITTYGDNSYGNRTSQTVNGKTTAFGFDAHGNLTSITDALGNATRFTCNSLGWRTSRTDALNRTTSYAHDTMGRLATTTYPDSSTTTLAYDADGNRSSMADATGTTTWAYNTINLTTSETKGTDSITYSYDAGGRRTSLTDQAGATVTYQYDGVDRLITASRSPAWNAAYSYDANSNLIAQSNPNGTTATINYNSADWLTAIVNKKSDGTVLSSFTYAHNTDGLRSNVTEADGSQVIYGYDPLHRLTSEVRSGTNPYNISYGYDPAGNRLNRVKDGVSTGYTYDDANRLLSAGSTTYSWNANGEMITKTESGVVTSFAYDFDDQLNSISAPTNVNFAYDGLGRRTSRTASEVTTTLAFDGNRGTTEKQGSTLIAEYTFGLERVTRDDGANFLYYLVDGLGSTRQLTDSGQNLAATWLFEGFGLQVAQTGSATNPYRFAGTFNYRNDDDAGLMLVGARYYDPQVGRFISADAWLGFELDPQGLNRYVYVENDAANDVDPTGEHPVLWIAAAAVLIGLGAWAGYKWYKKSKVPPPPGRPESAREKEKKMFEEQKNK